MFNNEILYIFGISTIGIVSIAYLLFGFSSSLNQTFPKKKLLIRGLKNVKNSCFINSLLQSLASSESMVSWICSTNTAFKTNSNLFFELSVILNEINNNHNNGKILSPDGVLDSLRKYRWVITSEEQDAFELFSVITSTLDLEFNNLSLVSSIRDIFSLQTLRLDDKFHQRKFLSRFSDFIQIHPKNSFPYRGILSNHLKCQNCNRSYPIQIDVFDSISLSLPENFNSPILLENCLKKFISNEEIEDFMCQFCNTKTTFTKKIELIKLPKLLCFHLKRQIWIGGCLPFKRIDHVKFPEKLSMDPFKCSLKNLKKIKENAKKNCPDSEIFCQNEKESSIPQNVYVLNSVIVHLGNSNSGHFICYRRKFDDKNKKFKWFYTSDLCVKNVALNEVLSCCAYMLFYEKN